MKSDIEIARSVNPMNIMDVAKKIGICDYIIPYGKYKAKISIDDICDKKIKSKLILVTAINPTPMGEGKTTVSISLSDALNKLGKKSILALREPSLGPVFGIKGGAAGGGYAQVIPMEDINLHFNGDFHAITSANNLLCSLIDNHIYFGNELGIDKVTFKRCLDLNDRQLRVINTGLSGESRIVPRVDGFDITAASEIMAILCLSRNIDDLKRRLGNIVIGYNKDGKEVTARDLKAEGAMAVLLHDAILPNLVQTLEGNPAIIHGGPFANIAHGCNSVIATNTAMKLGDYTVTEAGFGADLGAEKFLDIKCRMNDLNPDAVVLVATIRSLKYHGGMDKNDITKEDIHYLDIGMKNLYKHIDNLRNVYGLNVVVAINRFDSDTDKEISYLSKKLDEKNVSYALTTGFRDGSDGSLLLAEKVMAEANKKNNFSYSYDINDDIKTKIFKVANKIYGASDVIYDNKALEEIKNLEDNGHGNLPICIAKTQYSLSDDPNNLTGDNEYDIHVKEVILKAGAEFIVVLTGKIMTMPGLPKNPNSERIDIKDGIIEGIF
ncbi:MAG: formate--tetrahydrofolate ligase [Bacilli bacterium]|nr:formate--tetrahydrofolate ligase [Bacilli bacterium]MEE1371377.1 formate--tetrahydrofolate ligase [Bacilli bacterium]